MWGFEDNRAVESMLILSDLPDTGTMVTSGLGLLPRTMSGYIVHSQLGSILMSMAYSAN